MELQHDRLRDPCSFVFGMSRDEWIDLRKEWDEALQQIRYLEADKRVCSELLRNQGEIAGDAARLQAENEKLRKFIRERVADRRVMMNGNYHARRLCLEAEKLLGRD